MASSPTPASAGNSLVASLLDPSRPTFLLGDVPPGEGTPPGQAQEICSKFVTRSRSLACDGYIVYDIQDEKARSAEPRPFPFRRLVDPSGYAALVSKTSGKPCVVYKCVADPGFETWLDACVAVHGHRAINVVGRASSRDTAAVAGSSAEDARAAASGPTMAEAMRIARDRSPALAFGCVAIAERHTPEYAAARGHAAPREHENMIRKQLAGAQWFISQAIYDPVPTSRLLKDYAAACRARGLRPRKVVLTFTPVSREKTMRFVKWLGVKIPKETEDAVLAEETNEARVAKSVDLLCACLDHILADTAHLADDLPLGVAVESVSIYKAEINAVHDLFAKLQQRVLDARRLPWTVKWVHITRHDDAGDTSNRAGAEATVSTPPTPPISPLTFFAAGATIMAVGIIIGSALRRS